MIPRKPPALGTVLRYSYLWTHEAKAGRDEGVKDRPVALLLAKAPDEGRCIVVPITHTLPEDAASALEIPEDERIRLGLDLERAWIIVSEFNLFRWPGFDLRAVPGRRPVTVVYGRLAQRSYALALDRMKALLRENRIAAVPRT